MSGKYFLVTGFFLEQSNDKQSRLSRPLQRNTPEINGGKTGFHSRFLYTAHQPAGVRQMDRRDLLSTKPRAVTRAKCVKHRWREVSYEFIENKLDKNNPISGCFFRRPPDQYIKQTDIKLPHPAKQHNTPRYHKGAGNDLVSDRETPRVRTDVSYGVYL